MGEKVFSIIGGDLRNLNLANFLKEDGNNVKLFGFGDKLENDAKHNIIRCENLDAAIFDSDYIIGPLPCSNDDETLNTPFHNEKIYINEIFKKMTRNQIFIAGRLSSKIKQLKELYNVCMIDMFEREDIAVLNAMPTAEGAIQIAMEEMSVTLHGCNSLVLGYGRIGKILSGKLKALNSNVYVAARKYHDIAWIKSYGYNPIFVNELEKYIPNNDVIFNTVPCLILDEKLLQNVNKSCVLIDLASKPGGIDMVKADELGLKVKWALSLPGKVAPVTAAEIIKDTINNIITELGV